MKLDNIQLPSEKKFGFFFSIIFFIISIYYYLFKKYFLISLIFACLCILLIIISLIKPRALVFFNKLWMQFGLLLGKIISPVVLSVIFFGVFASTGFLMRLFGRDLLNLKFKKKLSYWKIRKSFTVSQTDFYKQF
jgi:hypothetical protein